jgi:nucleoside-diphosphate-sugar epimerase
MRVLIAGVNGYIGRALCKSLLGDAHEVVGLPPTLRLDHAPTRG